VFATLLWTIWPDGVMRQIFFILATTTWVMTLAINASPFMRFDGYFLLSDMLDFPNLHERSGACARWWVRRRFFGLQEPVPEPTFTAPQRRGLVGFALFVWIYRLTVFLGIALLVYHAFYKPLGVVLFILEIGFFIVRPVWMETRYLLTKIGLMRLAWDAFVVLFLVLGLLVWLIPVTSEVTAPAVMIAEREQAVFAPMPGQVREVLVKGGQRVAAGDPLMTLDSPELELRAYNASVELASARAEYLRGVATTRQEERTRVLIEQVNEALAEERAVEEERERLVLRATTAGVIRDLKAELTVGRWVNPRDLMMRIVTQDNAAVEAYVTDSQIGALQIGQPVKFIPDVPGMASIQGTVAAIDKTGTKQLQRQLLAAPHGGAVASVIDKKGQIVAKDAAYRVLITPSQRTSLDFVTRGTVRIETDLTVVAENFIYKALSILIRESGL
jgi:putative peptide zinc metalloprotease protein